MKTTKKNAGIKVTTSVKAGGIDPTGKMGGNHSRNALKIRTGIKAGATIPQANHNRGLLSLA